MTTKDGYYNYLELKMQEENEFKCNSCYEIMDLDYSTVIICEECHTPVCPNCYDHLEEKCQLCAD